MPPEDNLLHSFSRDDRRQHRRILLRFPLWWVKDAKAKVAVAGVGVEISAGGLQFLLQQKMIPTRGCTVLFTIEDRRMVANIEIKSAVDVVVEGQPMLHYRVMFLGLRETDFNFLITITGKLASKPLPQYDTLPTEIKYDIVNALVKMKRLSQATTSEASSLETRYAGKETPKGGTTFLRFNVRSKIKSKEGERVFDTSFLVSEDGTNLLIREADEA
jgi:hypothetical protein